MVPVALAVPPVAKLPPVIVPVAEAVPPVAKLPPVIVPVAEAVPPVAKLPPVTVPVELTNPPVNKFPPVTLAVAEIPAILKSASVTPSARYTANTFASGSFNCKLPKWIVLPLTYNELQRLFVLPNVYAMLAVGITLPVANTLAPDTSPVALTVPPVAKLPTVAVPTALIVPPTNNAFAVLVNVNPETALVIPPSLNSICVLAPGDATLPEMLPIKFAANTLPVALTLPAV